MPETVSLTSKGTETVCYPGNYIIHKGHYYEVVNYLVFSSYRDAGDPP